ncbi:hypothetical protein B0O80DRAFT_501195 [Mortierella sp. GBAus27b]|nr:hypothetical protein B0O80DRAFT_501195 [Mortierella sp. GBAus27b]
MWRLIAINSDYGMLSMVTFNENRLQGTPDRSPIEWQKTPGSSTGILLDDIFKTKLQLNRKHYPICRDYGTEGPQECIIRGKWRTTHDIEYSTFRSVSRVYWTSCATIHSQTTPTEATLGHSDEQSCEGAFALKTALNHLCNRQLENIPQDYNLLENHNPELSILVHHWN